MIVSIQTFDATAISKTRYNYSTSWQRAARAPQQGGACRSYPVRPTKVRRSQGFCQAPSEAEAAAL